MITQERIALEAGLRHALERGELSLRYQPQVSLKSGAATGVEALLRWSHREHGAVAPAKFIPIAEDTGFIVPIGDWVLRTACAQAAAWEKDGLGLAMSVNLSPAQFRQAGLADRVAAILAETGLAPDRLALEIAESTAMADPEQAVTVLGELRPLGVQLALDDFGNGHSSLNHLKRFPLDRLKIDRSFVRDLGVNDHDESIVKATVAIARIMKFKLTAVGVENEAQRALLQRAGCDEYQGFHFSRALPAPELLALLRVSGPSAPPAAR